MRFRLFHVLLMGDGLEGGRILKKKSHMSLALKKICTYISYSDSPRAEQRRWAHVRRRSVAPWLHVQMFMAEGSFFFFFLNDPAFSHPPVCTSAVTIVILMIAPQQKGHVCYPTLLNIHLTERRRRRQSACLAGRRLTGFLSDWLADWLSDCLLDWCQLIVCEGVN